MGPAQEDAMPAAVATSELLRSALDALNPATSEVAATLPVAASVAFEAFADVAATPRWLSVVQAASVLARDADGRPREVSFRAAFERATLGYVLHYDVRPAELAVSWRTSRAGSIQIDGEARFTALSASACLMTYRLSLDLPVSTRWLEAHYDNHAASAVVGDFREHLRRGR